MRRMSMLLVCFHNLPLATAGAVAELVLVRPLNNNEKYTRPRPPARPAMQRDERLPFLVSSVVCVRSWLGFIARLENRFMDRVPGCHGDTMSA
jgi:hypothetical protein